MFKNQIQKLVNNGEFKQKQWVFTSRKISNVQALWCRLLKKQRVLNIFNIAEKKHLPICTSILKSKTERVKLQNYRMLYKLAKNNIDFKSADIVRKFIVVFFQKPQHGPLTVRECAFTKAYTHTKTRRVFSIYISNINPYVPYRKYTFVRLATYPKISEFHFSLDIENIE